MKQPSTPENYIESLFSNNELYLILFEQATDAIIFTTRKSIVDCNESARLLLGISEKCEITGKSIVDFSPENQPDGQTSQELWNEILTSSVNIRKAKFGWKIAKAGGREVDTEIVINSFDHGNQNLYQLTIHDLTNLRSKEIALKESESKYKKIFENVQDVFYQTDLNGIITEISPSISKYSKYIFADVIGQPLEKFYYNPEERKRLLNEIAKNGEVHDFEVLLKGRNDQLVWGSVNAHFIYDDNGNVAGVEGTIRDLTERKQVEENYKYSLSLLQATLDSTTDGILVTNLDSKITWYNTRFKEMFHHKQETLESREDSAIINAVLNQMKYPDQFVSKIQYLYENIDIESFDTIELTDGRILERYSRPQLLDGKPVGRVWNFRDVTERRNSEQQIQLMAHTIKSINESVSITDTSNKILFVNDAFLKTYGFDNLNELVGKDISFVRSDNNDPNIVNRILSFTENSGWHGEIFNRRKDGTEFPISLSTSVVQNEKGEVLGLVGVAVDITERKAEELKLKESEERYRAFFEGSPDAIFLADSATGYIIDANCAASRLMKMPVEKLIGMHQSQLHPAETNEFSRKNFKEDIVSIESPNKGRSHEDIVQCSDGSRIPVEIMANIIHIKGNPVLQGVFRDISARKKAEEALQDKEAHLRTLVQTIPDLIWLKDINGVYVTCNKTFEQFFGSTLDEIVGKTDYDYVSKELADFFRENDLKAIEAGCPVINEEWITYASDGHQALLETIKTPMYDAKGNVIGVLGIGRDITDRNKADERLRESELKYRTLIESMPDGIYRSTPDGKFVEVNQAMVKILGYDDKDDLMKIDIKSQLYFKLEDRESRVLMDNSEELDVYPLRKKDGTAVWVEDHGWYVRDEQNQILFHEGVIRDITERKLAENQLKKYSEELKELNATKDKFFSIIAHDLKSPFNSIVGLSDIIKTEAKNLDIATIEQYAGIIHTTSSNTYRLLENLLDWARLQRSQVLFRPVSVILKNLVNDVIEIMLEKANSKMIAVINYIPDNLIVWADEEMLKTIFRNLISNALKFTPGKGKVEIKSTLMPGEIQIAVSDTGIGITKDDIKKLFRIESNVSKRGTQNEQGTGLGLLICKEFVEKHDGRIWIESEPRQGSNFMFTLKIKE